MPVPLSEVTFQYWFNGPDGVATVQTTEPNQLFQLTCNDATTGEAVSPPWPPALNAASAIGNLYVGSDEVWLQGRPLETIR